MRSYRKRIKGCRRMRVDFEIRTACQQPKLVVPNRSKARFMVASEAYPCPRPLGRFWVARCEAARALSRRRGSILRQWRFIEKAMTSPPAVISSIAHRSAYEALLDEETLPCAAPPKGNYRLPVRPRSGAENTNWLAGLRVGFQGSAPRPFRPKPPNRALVRLSGYH